MRTYGVTLVAEATAFLKVRAKGPAEAVDLAMARVTPGRWVVMGDMDPYVIDLSGTSAGDDADEPAEFAGVPNPR